MRGSRVNILLIYPNTDQKLYEDVANVRPLDELIVKGKII